jgi:hypothetical protein
MLPSHTLRNTAAVLRIWILIARIDAIGLSVLRF